MRPQKLIVSLLAAMVLVGCADDPEPKIAAKPSLTPDALPSSSPSVKVETPEAFLTEWFQAGTVMQNTGTTETFLALTVSCGPCKRLAKTVTEIYDAGGSIVTAPATVISVSLLGRRDKLSEYVVDVETPPTSIRRLPDADPERLPGARNTYRFSLYATAGGLKVENYLLRSKA